jgi:hypothetical protein
VIPSRSGAVLGGEPADENVDPVQHRDLLERHVLLLLEAPHGRDDGADLGLGSDPLELGLSEGGRNSRREAAFRRAVRERQERRSE